MSISNHATEDENCAHALAYLHTNAHTNWCEVNPKFMCSLHAEYFGLLKLRYNGDRSNKHHYTYASSPCRQPMCHEHMCGHDRGRSSYRRWECHVITVCLKQTGKMWIGKLSLVKWFKMHRLWREKCIKWVKSFCVIIFYTFCLAGNHFEWIIYEKDQV
jgi:hypothetical protein